MKDYSHLPFYPRKGGSNTSEPKVLSESILRDVSKYKFPKLSNHGLPLPEAFVPMPEYSPKEE